MNKKTASFVVVCLLLAVGTYVSVGLYKSLRNTPERVTQTFIQDLEAGDTTRAYGRLTNELKQDREQYWKDYFAGFKAHEGEASLVSQEFVEDAFKTYPNDSQPQRFVYKFRLQGRDYILTVVTFKLQNVWVIGQLSGLYKS